MKELPLAYNYPIVIISVVIAMFACSTSFELLKRSFMKNSKSHLWLICSAVIMGLGIWSMHFTGMLAYKVDIGVSYDGLLTILSMVLAIVSALFSFWVLRFGKEKQRTLVLAALLMAAGICSMHFVGMHGMILSANMVHDLPLVALAGIFAFGVSYFSFLAFSSVKNHHYSLFHLPVALLMAAGVCATHYTAMASVTFVRTPSENLHIHASIPHFTLNTDYMLLGIVIATLIFIAIMHSLLMKDKRKTEENINFLAFHDNLTGLANRLQLTKHIEMAVTSPKQQELAVIYVDLDRFKIVNDTMGHDYGDELLIQASNRLRECVRKSDLVARQGGDEFIVLAKEVDRKDAAVIAKKIIHCFSKPFYLKGEEFFMSASIGISTYPKDGSQVSELIKFADKAMYEVKKHGKNNYQFYLHEEKTEVEKKLKLEQGLKRALENEEFELFYQPKVELDTQKVYGVEALIRWNHPDLGMVPPLDFIPIAEQTGMILPIGDWVLNEAIRQNKEWLKDGKKIQMAINVSNLQFEDHLFIEKVKKGLEIHQLPAECLELEITESVMQNISHSAAIINELKEIGVLISIDDFGTGYSSLSLLNSLPIDIVKIDRSFIKDMLSSRNASVLVKTIIEMGDNLNFRLVAEGIEDENQLSLLIDKGCHYGQGYLFSPPLAVAKFEGWLQAKGIERSA
ncbi:EAL domain-containing protein [Planococcus sp. NCCP-2050]|uniref:bifunctional diguanylate cyclase/phosphodiesterase n=1 Tax=Planococcus sp. NCCP-2050 TaxID=2944679 RepID=UPI00203C5FF7|nr:EAL domain-containing protein [Planococcus sp. NCCP-2050]GKW44487.1 putative signaling protein [Planococcus sp. NCCP-2050]